MYLSSVEMSQLSTEEDSFDCKKEIDMNSHVVAFRFVFPRVSCNTIQYVKRYAQEIAYLLRLQKKELRYTYVKLFGDIIQSNKNDDLC